MAVWVKLCEEEVETQNKRLDGVKFAPEALAASLSRLKKIALNPDVEDSLRSCRKRLNKCGVYLVDYPAVGNAKIRGVLTMYEGNPAIYISKRFKTHDHVWCALIHELAHLLLCHSDVDEGIALQGCFSSSPEKEEEANIFARDFFVDPISYQSFVKQRCFSLACVRRFAAAQGVHEGVVVGFLQHDGYLGFDELNDLKVYCE